jgi:hypothetical protein
MIGTVTDATGGVLPGVTVTATNVESGNTFVAVTDERGDFRMPVRVGNYRVTTGLAGFMTINRTLQILVGQTAVVNIQMAPSTIQESVTVTGEAPLVDTTTSTVGANIDPRQMTELPLNGRSWMDLTLLAPGARRNEGGGLAQLRQGYAQTNVDGQQVTSNWHSATDAQQPAFNRDAIAEFEAIANRFDATQGRSSGMVVNAITKSGTNTPAGLFSGYFRDDRFNAADFIQDRVLPYSNQQLSTTFGGPIRKDRIHFFGNYEYEREPQTVTYSSPFPSFNVDQSNTRREHKQGARLDVQFTSQTRLAVRDQDYREVYFEGGGATAHPSSANRFHRHTNQFLGTLTQVFGSQAVNEVRGGFALNASQRDAFVTWKGGCIPNQPVGCFDFTPRILFSGYSFGGAGNTHGGQDMYSIRDNFTLSYTKGGRHVMKLGGEYIYYSGPSHWCASCYPTLEARNSRPPANIEALIPVWNDASTWNLAALSPLVTQVRQAVSYTGFNYHILESLYGGWVQDDWTVTPHLTLNLGLRWDMQAGVNSEKVRFPPWLPGDLPYDKNNFAPRLGFAFSLNDQTVIRGGYGRFYTQAISDGTQQTALSTVSTVAEIRNDGRPDFAANPFNGPVPTYEAVLANACDIVGLRPGCLRREIPYEINHPWRRLPYSHQASMGLQRQLGTTMAVEADYVYAGGRGEESSYNLNRSFNPATGANYPFSDLSKRPFPEWGLVMAETLEGWSNSHGLQTAFTKRLSQWQASATYTLSGLWDALALPYQYGLVNGTVTRQKVGFPLAPDMGGEYTLAATDQRHRAVFNGIWDAGSGFQLSGIYFYGAGKRFNNSYGGDLRDIGGGGGTGSSTYAPRLRPDGTIVPRNSLVGKPIHRVDLRVQRRVRLGGRATVDGLLEVFNLFNHANYGSYVTLESNRNYGQPSFNSNIAYQPRILQLGFRASF